MGRGIVPAYTKVIVIVHGLSEYCICKNIQSNLRIKQEIISRKKGKSSIQITSLLDILNDKRFQTVSGFKRAFPDVECIKKKPTNFKVFIIMDVDDCTEKQKQSFINKEMFSNHWLYNYIVPIYNDPNLEKSMRQARINIIKKKDYIQIFPTNHGDLDLQIAQDFSHTLKYCKRTNLEEYVQYCINICKDKLIK